MKIEKEYEKWKNKEEERVKKRLKKRKNVKRKVIKTKKMEKWEEIDKIYRKFLSEILFYHAICETVIDLCLTDYFNPYMYKSKIGSKTTSLFVDLILYKMNFDKKRILLNKILEDSEKLKLNIKELNEIRNKLAHYDYWQMGIPKLKIKINNKNFELNFKNKKSFSKIDKEIHNMFLEIHSKLYFLLDKINKRNKRLKNS